MTRSLAWLTGSLLLLSMGCPGPVAPEDMSSGGRDMAAIDLAPEEVDLAPGEPNRCRGDGCIGGPCNTSADCTEGKEGVPKICWKETLLNNPRYVPTPGGYCTQECQTHADCGTGYCFQMPGEPKKYCMALCRTATTCRKPGYACTLEAGAGMDGICFPDKNLDCQPTKGVCDATISGGGVVKGGCIRAAFEDKGICRVACQVGVRTCPPDTRFGTQNPPPQHCVFLDTTTDSAGRPSPTGDKWKGAVCLEFAPMPVMPGQRCSFWDECTDGYQCDRYAQRPEQQVCRQLCVQGNGVQDPTLYVPPGAMPAGNMCANPGEGCSNALQAGAQNGQPGLCTPRN